MRPQNWLRDLAFALLAGSLLAAPGAASGTAAIELHEVSGEWGLAFRHRHAGTGRRFMVETMVGGVVLFDYDQDGDPDAFFVDAAPLPGYRGDRPQSRLLRNDGRRFVDVTDRSGLRIDSYGCGGSAADFDGDGDLDLYVTAYGRNNLFENLGDGRFRDVTAQAGVGDLRWSTSSAWLDSDGDGDLDLYVVNYVDFEIGDGVRCHDQLTGLEKYCNPAAFRGLRDSFYRNLGDGRFADETLESGLGGPRAAGLGVVASDLNGDGRPDLYVANDADPNLLFLNRGNGTFEDVSLLSGAALGDTGKSEAGMGVDAGDVDGDGRFDLVVTNFSLETNALYRNQGDGVFVDGRYLAKIAEESLAYLGFGVALADLDHDTDSDLVVANGHIYDNAEQISSGVGYAQVNHLFENRGGTYRLLEGAFSEKRVSRGLATADLDADGDLDLVITNNNDLAEVYRNDGEKGSWLQVDLLASGANVLAVGSRLVLESAGASAHREVRVGSSYLSQHALTVHFGGGEAASGSLDVLWPDGRRQRLDRVPLDRRLRVHRAR